MRRCREYLAAGMAPKAPSEVWTEPRQRRRRALKPQNFRGDLLGKPPNRSEVVPVYAYPLEGLAQV